MSQRRLGALSLVLAGLPFAVLSLGSACGGSVSAITHDAGPDGASGSSSGSITGSSSGGFSSSSSGSSSGTSSGSSGGSSSGSSSGVSSSSSSGSSSGGNDTCANLPPSSCMEPPGPASGVDGGATTTAHDYAVHRLYLGDTDRQGNPSATAWQTFGYDLDGKITSASSTDVCSLVPGASKQVQVDGNGGIDNSWGSQIMPILDTLDSTTAQTVNDELQAGVWTQMTYVVGFDDSTGNTTSATGLTGVVLMGATYSSSQVPSWDLSTNWPVAPEFISGCTPTMGCPAGTDPVKNAQLRLTTAYQTSGTFVSGSPIDLTLPLDIGGQVLPVNLHHATLSFSPQAPGSVTNGTLAGVVSTSDLIDGLQQVAGRVSTSLCSGSAFQSIAMQIEQTSDILLNGSSVSNVPGMVCNAISVGMGFDSTEIAAPSVIAPPAPAMPDPCGDGG